MIFNKNNIGEEKKEKSGKVERERKKYKRMKVEKRMKCGTNDAI